MLVQIMQKESIRGHLIFDFVDEIIEVFLGRLVVTFAGESFIDEFMIFLSVLFGHGH